MEHDLEMLSIDTRPMANITIGTPPQQVLLSIDTMYSDLLVVNATTAANCKNNLTAHCVENGAFDASNSSSLESLSDSSDPFNRTLPGGVNVVGSYYKDRVVWDDVVLNNTVIAVANESTRGNGVLGLGYNRIEDSGAPDGYTSFMQSLLQDNQINKLAYSVGVYNNYTEGELLLGGVDLGMAAGSLYAMSMLPVVDTVSERPENYVFVPLTQVCVANEHQQVDIMANSTVPVMLDTANTLSYLPYDVVVNIAAQLNALYTKDLNLWVQGCQFKNVTGQLNFYFGDALIEVPISQLLIPLIDSNSGEPHYFVNGMQVCALSFVSSDLAGYSALGSNILSSAYLVMDLDARQVGIAPANQNTTIEHDYHNITSALGNETFATTIELTSTPTATIAAFSTQIQELRSLFPMVSLSPEVISKLEAEHISSPAFANTLIGQTGNAAATASRTASATTTSSDDSSGQMYAGAPAISPALIVSPILLMTLFVCTI